jgi:hypothetical protein
MSFGGTLPPNVMRQMVDCAARAAAGPRCR